MDSKKMLYKISPEDNGKDSVRSILEKHPEVEFVSLVGVDGIQHRREDSRQAVY